jgi:hypothetical protein
MLNSKAVNDIRIVDKIRQPTFLFIHDRKQTRGPRLLMAHRPGGSQLSPGKILKQHPVDEHVPTTHFLQEDQLGTVVEKFNESDRRISAEPESQS